MYKKSELLEKLLSSCEKTGKNISASKFVAEVLNMLDQKILYKAYKEEIASLEELFSVYKINYAVAAAGINAILDSKTEEFMDAYLLTRIFKDYEIRYMESDDHVVTVSDVCRNILEKPTAVIREAVINCGASSETVATGSTGPELAEAKVDSAAEAMISDLLAQLGKAAGGDGEVDSVKEDRAEDAQGGKLAGIVQRTDALRDVLSANVYGQDHAISEFISGYFRAELSAITEENRTKPKATFLFAGPPGVGKTFLSEQVAKALKLPFRRFDMSEYADKESHLEFCGSDKVYKNSGPGNVTSFVAENPECVLLFDEVEKCHLVVTHLFLQILDAGRLRDNYTDKEVSFKDAIIILTTNAGKQMYEDESINLLTASRKSILHALSTDMNPVTGAPLFPAAICSRFASGSVIMFNRMSASNLLKISETEIKRNFGGITEKTGINIEYDSLLPCALVYAEGGKADARTVKGKSSAFVFNELYELMRLINSDSCDFSLDSVKTIKFELQMPDDGRTAALFRSEKAAEILLFADKAVCDKCAGLIEGVTVNCASTVEEAKRILDKGGITLVLCDITCGTVAQADVLNIEDIDSEGRSFFNYVTEMTRIPVYMLEPEDRKTSKEEYLSMSKSGAMGIFSADGERPLGELVVEGVDKAYRQAKLFELARANRVLKYNTLQYLDKEKGLARIVLFDFRMVTAVDAEDADDVLNGVSRPDIRFGDVIGAKDAKDELSYFVDYLKNPIEFVRHGVKAPKGILLYGPPGTGKTLLAKAMAGESDVTFISAEGNQFLKRWVGEGPENVHALFQTARKYAPSILFIDEIDAIGRERGSGTATEFTGDVLTSFLTEMDGFKTDKDRPVFVLAATNYDVEDRGKGRSLDPALLRRFDRRIFVGLPDREARTEFINRKLKKVTNHNISAAQVENLAVRSTGASLADLDSAIELAMRNVIKSKGYTLTDEILEEAFETFYSGEIRKWNPDGLKRTARHEAGHALVCRYCGEKPSYLTIVARGQHGGYMQHADNEGKGNYTKKDLISRIMTALGGRAAELVCYGEDGLSTGASGDLQTATSVARAMICDYGMDETVGLGTLSTADLAGQPGMIVAERVNAILKEQLDAAMAVIEKNRNILDKLTDTLLEKNSLREDELEEILREVK